MIKKHLFIILILYVGINYVNAVVIDNDLYRITLQDNNAFVAAVNTPTQKLTPEFTIMYSDRDPGYGRNHRNYFISHRHSVRWSNISKDIAFMNKWINSPEMKSIHGYSYVEIIEDKNGQREWFYKDHNGIIKATVDGKYAQGTSYPFFAGQKFTVNAVKTTVTANTVIWYFDEHPYFSLNASLILAKPDGEPKITYTIKVKKDGYYSVAFTGAPKTDAKNTLSVPQQVSGRQHRQFNHLISEGYLKLPRAHIATDELNYTIVTDPQQSPFRLVNHNNSLFGMMIQLQDGKLKPIAFTPIMGGKSSKMKTGQTHSFAVYYVQRPGDWKDTYKYIAKKIYKFRDMRDNSGPGSLNSTLENIIDYLIDRDGHNYAMWHTEQKYYNYWSDKAGVFKPFSPIFGLTAGVITDDEEFYWKRILPQVEFAVSRKSNVFSPYDLFDNGQVKSNNRDLGSPYVSSVQLETIHHMFQRHTYAFNKLAQENVHFDSLKDIGWGNPGIARGQGHMDMLELYEATGDKKYLDAALDRAYHIASKLNLFPTVPDTELTFEENNKVPIHNHSYGRHKAWGFPQPKKLEFPQQTVPAWRASLIGIESIAYRGEYWMNDHGTMMRIATHADDTFLRDLCRWGMVGRFANYPGDNRSNHSLVSEFSEATEKYIYETNYATFNPGHAWDIVGAFIDFLLSDVFNRSKKMIDFPARSMQGSAFRVRAYGDRPGRFYNEDNIMLWLPRKLVSSDNKQVDYVAGYGNDRFYIAFWSQSFEDEDVTIKLNKDLVDCILPHPARVWRQNKPAGNVSISDNTITFQVKPKGIVAYAIDDVKVKTSLHNKMFAGDAIDLGPDGFKRIEAPFGNIHAMLISMGKGLTSAFVYTDALPEDVIFAKFKYRQGNGQWNQVIDEIFPFELSGRIDETAGDFECILEIENASQQVQTSKPIFLKF